MNKTNPAKRRKTIKYCKAKKTALSISPLHDEFICAKNADNSSGVTNREKEILEEIRRAIASKKDLLSGYSAVLFGSRAKGTSRERSDFDIGICGDKPLSPGTLASLADRLDEIETLYRIDLVDFQLVSNRFRECALQHTEVLYG